MHTSFITGRLRSGPSQLREGMTVNDYEAKETFARIAAQIVERLDSDDADEE